MSADLAAFLNARYDEADALADDDPAHRDIAAKRAVVKLYADTQAIADDPEASAVDRADAEHEAIVLLEAVELLATEYAGHPDYRGEWRP